MEGTEGVDVEGGLPVLEAAPDHYPSPSEASKPRKTAQTQARTRKKNLEIKVKKPKKIPGKKQNANQSQDSQGQYSANVPLGFHPIFGPYNQYQANLAHRMAESTMPLGSFGPTAQRGNYLPNYNLPLQNYFAPLMNYQH